MNSLSLLFYFILPIFGVIFIFLNKKFSHFKDRGIPHSKPSWPLGNLKGVGSKTHLYYVIRETYERFKDKDVIAGLYSFFQPIYIITDLDLAKQILIRDFNKFVNRGTFVNEEHEPLTGSLVALEDDKWRFIRNKLSPVFTSGKLKSMFDVISSKGEDFVEALNQASAKGPIEMKDMAHRFTLDIVSSVAFGMEANTLKGDNPDLLYYSKVLLGAEGISTFKLFFLLTFPDFSKFLNFRLFSKEITAYLYKIIGGNIKYREESKENRNDFINMLVQLKNKGSIDGEFSSETKKLTLDQCIAQATTFLSAGSDTSSTTISASLIEIAKNQDIQSKMREEILEKTKASNGKIIYDNLQELMYMNQVMNETLRTFTIGFSHFRMSNEDYKIPNSNHVIPKRTLIWIPTVGYHFDKQHWKDPYTFNPEHFSKEQVENRHQMAFIPFGDGPRNCIGMRFGQLNVKYALALVLKNFKITLDSRTQYPIKINPKSFQLEVEGGCWLRLEKI